MTERPKHTPGPWDVRHSGPKGDYLTVNAGSLKAETTQRIVGVVYGATEETQIANARLIAAAPDLLEALRPFTSLSTLNEGTDSSIVHAARAAIAKATGGTDA